MYTLIDTFVISEYKVFQFQNVKYIKLIFYMFVGYIIDNMQYFSDFSKLVNMILIFL